jgi:AcrR family transcriptional regulator
MNKPLKRPSQQRARFTVQAIYDAFVRIWRRDGWDRLTTRAVALETGISVGTLYEYFPNKLALLSGYIRHCIEALLACIDRTVVAPPQIPWRERVGLLVRLTCGVEAPSGAWLHPQMLALEAQLAELKHHRRVHDELLAAWRRVFDACEDLAVKPDDDALRALLLAAWGGRRYALLLEIGLEEAQSWAGHMERLCVRAVEDLQPT